MNRMSNVKMSHKNILLEIIRQKKLGKVSWGHEINWSGQQLFFCEVDIDERTYPTEFSIIRAYSQKENGIEAENEATGRIIKEIMDIFNFEVEDINYKWKQRCILQEDKCYELEAQNEQLKSSNLHIVSKFGNLKRKYDEMLEELNYYKYMNSHCT